MAVWAYRLSSPRPVDSLAGTSVCNLHAGRPRRRRYRPHKAVVRFPLWLLAAALGFLSLDSSAQRVPTHGLCKADEEAVFSCALKGKAGKTVSLCASPKPAQGDTSFRYRYGRPSKIELEYPSVGDGNDSFTRTPLRWGAMVGHAFAFTNAGYKYILYSTEGLRDARVGESGLLVQRAGQMYAASDTQCRPSSNMESKSDALWDATSRWKVDEDLEAHGLPITK